MTKRLNGRLGRRPVMTRDELLAIGQQILRYSTLDQVNATVTHTARVMTKLANDRVLSSDDGESIRVEIYTTAARTIFSIYSNQLDDHVLRACVQQCERLLRTLPTYTADDGMKHEPVVQDSPVPVELWHEPTIHAMASARNSVIPEILRAVQRDGLQASGFIGLMARARVAMRKDGEILFFHDETDTEVNVVARDLAGKSLGWSGQAARDWSEIDLPQLTQHAVEVAKRGVNPVAVEPGRRIAILTSAAVAQLLRYFAGQWDALSTDAGRTALSKSPHGGNKLGQRILDPRLRMSSHPNDPDGGYQPYIVDQGVATPPMQWVDKGVLVNLAYSMDYAMARGKSYAQRPFSMRLTGGTTTIEQMIAQCKEGILVNHVSDVELLDEHTCLLTGVTHGGCFLVKDGKISKSIKNFRFLESPFFFLNRIEALGVPERAAFGPAPKSENEPPWDSYDGAWPRQPMIVPPMMVRDFNFASLADVV